MGALWLLTNLTVQEEKKLTDCKSRGLQIRLRGRHGNIPLCEYEVFYRLQRMTLCVQREAVETVLEGITRYVNSDYEYLSTLLFPLFPSYCLTNWK